MSEATTPTKPLIAKPAGNPHGSLSERLIYWARYSTLSKQREDLLAAARALQQTESNAKGM